MLKIVKPQVKLWKQTEGTIAHVARCARVCYASNKTDNNEKLYLDLELKGHLSMFRHESLYFIVDRFTYVAKDITNNYENCPYIEFVVTNDKLYVATNGQFIREYEYNEDLAHYIVTDEQFANTEIGLGLMRYTFNVITQISTSRELNRVSPNNIAEQSTRYCNFSRGKFEGQCAICQPHWFDLEQQEAAYYKNESGIQYYKIDDGEFHPYCNTNITFNKYGDNPKRNLMFQRYILDTNNSCEGYLKQVECGMLAQDARGQLPIDLATECCYTYSINEWRHILNLRYYGTTGAPHPNAKIIAGMIREKLIGERYDFR